MTIDDLVLDAIHDPDKDLDSKSGTVEVDGRLYSATCHLNKNGYIFVYLRPTTREEPLGDVLVAGKDTIFRFEPPKGTQTLGKVLVDTGREI